jgi:hypothetical protein
METSKTYRLVPSFGNSFGTGWQVMMDNFLRLFLVVIILVILTGPFTGLDFKFDSNQISGIICLSWAMIWASEVCLHLARSG